MKRKNLILRICTILLVAILLSSTFTVYAKADSVYANTGNGAIDIVEVARTQIGYKERYGGYTKYGKAMGNGYCDWCCAFVVWCARQAGIDENIIPETASCSAMYSMLDKEVKHKSQSKGGGYVPKSGDLVFFKNLDHIGIVESVTSSSVCVIEGNCSDKVKVRTYSLKDSYLFAFAAPEYKEVSFTKVIDISKFNPEDTLDWKKLKASGVDSVVIRIGGRYVKEKTIYEDPAFSEHYKAAKEARMHVGVYFFSYAATENEALEEVQFTIETLRKYECELDFPVFIDIEDYSASDGKNNLHKNLGKEACTSIVDTFCNAIEEAGYYPGIYCSESFAEDLLEADVFSDRATWIAHYGVSSCTYSGNWDMWQYTSTGVIDGSAEPIDISYCYTDFSATIAEKTEKEHSQHILGPWITLVGVSLHQEGKKAAKCVVCGEVFTKTIKRPSYADAFLGDK